MTSRPDTDTAPAGASPAAAHLAPPPESRTVLELPFGRPAGVCDILQQLHRSLG